MTRPISWILVASDYTVLGGKQHVNDFSYYIAISAIVASTLSIGYYIFATGFNLWLLQYVLLLMVSAILLAGWYRRQAIFYLPFVVFESPRLVVSLILTTYQTASVMLWHGDPFNQKLYIVFLAGIVFLIDVIQLYFVYIVYNAYRWLKEDIAKRQRMAYAVEHTEDMSVYP
ncbi:hypothetical protein M3Y94_00878600 [Aphelenchoides besseyi]|nr:hypothetical protein M3Y94_00878600 [Aphelenchoides besseyi]KAI6226579.1 hypothetical protein M3Y95_00635800 [Aphelenchoides besseyi]